MKHTCHGAIHCGCSCHYMPGVKHFRACCDGPVYKEKAPSIPDEALEAFLAKSRQ